MKASDIEVTLSVNDRISPAIKRIGRRLWWMQYGGFVTSGLVLAVLFFGMIAAFLLGRISA